MPPKRSKRLAEKSGQADPPAGPMTPEEIAAALEQLMEGQRQAQQQIEALLTQQGISRPAVTLPRSTEGGRAPAPARSGPQEDARRTDDAREVINDRRAARERRPENRAQLSARGDPTRSHGDLRHVLNRNRAQTLSRSTAPNEEEASTSDPSYHSDASRVRVEARIEELERRIGRMADPRDRRPARDRVCTDTESPFSRRITRFLIPRRFKQPHLESYDGTGSPVDHVRTYKAQMALATNSDELLCLAFPGTLKGPAAQWFHSLKPRSVPNFGQLSKQFVSQFVGMLDRPQPDTQLLTVRQQKGESLKDFVDRFNKQKLRTYDLDETVAITAFCSGVQHNKCAASFHRNRPASLVELSERVGKYIDTEEFLKSKNSGYGDSEPGKRKRKQEGPDSGQGKRSKPGRADTGRDTAPMAFTPLNRPIHEIMVAAERQNLLRAPPKMKGPPGKRNQDKYCRYHRDNGHDTEDCFRLKIAIEKLIEAGHLADFVQNRPPRNEARPAEQPQPLGHINVVSGGTSGGGDSRSARKRHARASRADVASVRPMVPPRGDTLTFSTEDEQGVHYPHDDPLVVTLTIANYAVKRVLIDTGSSSDILFSSAFDQLGISRDRLRPVATPLVGFNGSSTQPLGMIELPVLVGTHPQQVATMTNFIVVETPSAYNVILGRPTLNRIRAVVSTHGLIVKFPTPQGTGTLKGDQVVARNCYATSLRGETRSETLVVEDPRDEKDGMSPVEDIEHVVLDPELPDRLVGVGSLLQPEVREELINFLRQNQDVFAWSHEDMPGIDPEVMSHRLNVDPEARPVKQKRRGMAAERQQAVQEEVGKLLAAHSIREVQYPDWLANVVLVRKSNNKWRLCVDFTDLNKACPKDCYPLPRIDLLVDATAGHSLLSFMDAYSGYNQIRMFPGDEGKTSFITDGGTYCYKVMPFGLKNAGATYQRLVNHMFRDQIGRSMEVYVDDLLVKSREDALHLPNLAEAFQVLRKFRMKLNPTKCAFGVSSGRFLGHLISRRGIEANPEKIQAIINMQSPRTVKEVQSLAGRVAALNRFVSRATDRCLPFFKTLRKTFEWSEECEKAFQELKKYLTSPPLLSIPVPGEELLLYLAISPSAVSSALVREEQGKQHPVYYTSRALQGAESRYSRMEKLAFALITSARRLRPYFQAHTIVVLTDQPLRRMLCRPETSGRLMKWSLELEEFEVLYRPRTAIKGQALADFVAEFTYPDGPTEEVTPPTLPPGLQGSLPTWTLYVDGSSNSQGSGAGIIIISPDGIRLEYALRFGFKASNNVAEYEALLVGLQLATMMGAEQVKIHSDSQLVVNQVLQQYEARENSMAAYLSQVRAVTGTLKGLCITQIPREENAEADRLARLASSSETDLTGTRVEFLSEPSVPGPDRMDVDQAGPAPSWMDPILAYLTTGSLPTEKTEARRVRYRSAKYHVIDGILYKRGYTLPYLRCIGPTQVGAILSEIHDGICGSHVGGRALSRRALLQGYYWPTMARDSQDYVRRCEKCQKFANISSRPGVEQTPMLSPWPFCQWGIDLVGPLPMAKGQVRFAIVAVDYFTKWAEAEPLATITEKKIENFVLRNILSRFGVPRVLVSDNGRQFDTPTFRKFCSNYGIANHYSSPEHPQANGQAEVTNRTILQSIKTRLDRAKGLWAEELPTLLWAYRTTPRAATGETPFSLTYGSEAMVPTELAIPSFRVASYHQQENAEALRVNLDLVDEKRDEAFVRAAAYKQRISQYFNKKVKHRSFQVGELVLKAVNQSTRDPSHGKLGPNWEGPYQVSRINRPGTYWLQTLEGRELPHPWNVEHLRKYYQ